MADSHSQTGLNTQQIIDTRSFLAANVETILEHLSVLREDQKNDSDDLFGEADDTSAGITWKPTKALSSFEVLLNEGESLGLFVSGNPLEKYVPFLEWVKSTTFRDDIFLVLFNKVRKIFTKKNLMMFAIEVSTPDEDYEAIIFPKNALKYSPLLAEKQLYWVKGKISDGSERKKKYGKQSPEVTENIAIDDEPAAAVIEEETPEYEEKPKIIIDALTKFEDGVLSLFADENLGFTQARQRIIESVDWKNIKTDPTNFEDFIGQETSENSQIQQNNSSTETTKAKSSLASLVVKTLKLPQSLGKEKLKIVKESLLTSPIQNGVPVEVMVQTADGWKKAKGTFYVDPFLLHTKGIDVEIS